MEITCNEIVFFFFQAEDGIRDLVRSRGLGDVYKRQGMAADALVEVHDHAHLGPDLHWYTTSPLRLSLIHI